MRAAPNVPRMLLSYVLRLIESEAAAGRVVGEVEDVRSGVVRRIRCVDDLVVAVRESQLNPEPLAPEA